MFAVNCQKAVTRLRNRVVDPQSITFDTDVPLLEAIDDVQTVIETAGTDASICVLPEGPQMIPFIS